VPPSAKDFERAARELRRLDRRNRWLLRTDRGGDLPGFIAGLQDSLDAATHYEFLSRLAHAMLKVVSTLRVQGD